jgi:hypothetical protein
MLEQGIVELLQCICYGEESVRTYRNEGGLWGEINSDLSSTDGGLEASVFQVVRNYEYSHLLSILSSVVFFCCKVHQFPYSE